MRAWEGWALARAKRINLALQGGGAHGAFTWGVLDHLLEQETLGIAQIAATSAGAVNAVALASGLASGGRAGAQAKLREVWEAIHKAGMPDFVRLNPMLAGFGSLASSTNMARMFSPYDFNPMGVDPLRQLLTKTIDFDAIRASGLVELSIAATDIATGRPRFFRTHEITVDAVLASACLPTLHHAVEIDGRAYWDGGFSANPGIVDLAMTSPVRDTLIVMLNATLKPGKPISAPEIAGATNRLTFNAPLLRDVEIIEAVREAQGSWLARRFRRPPRLSPLARHRFHLVEAGRHTSGLPPDTKLKPDWGLFTYLHGAGKIETAKWLDGARASIGRRSTVDLKARFLSDPPIFRVGDQTRSIEPAPTPPVSPDVTAGPAARTLR
jgi:NTE family protein